MYRYATSCYIEFYVNSMMKIKIRCKISILTVLSKVVLLFNKVSLIERKSVGKYHVRGKKGKLFAYCSIKLLIRKSRVPSTVLLPYDIAIS